MDSTLGRSSTRPPCVARRGHVRDMRSLALARSDRGRRRRRRTVARLSPTCGRGTTRSRPRQRRHRLRPPAIRRIRLRSTTLDGSVRPCSFRVDDELPIVADRRSGIGTRRRCDLATIDSGRRAGRTTTWPPRLATSPTLGDRYRLRSHAYPRRSTSTLSRGPRPERLLDDRSTDSTIVDRAPRRTGWTVDYGTHRRRRFRRSVRDRRRRLPSAIRSAASDVTCSTAFDPRQSHHMPLDDARETVAARRVRDSRRRASAHFEGADVDVRRSPRRPGGAGGTPVAPTPRPDHRLRTFVATHPDAHAQRDPDIQPLAVVEPERPSRAPARRRPRPPTVQPGLRPVVALDHPGRHRRADHLLLVRASSAPAAEPLAPP